MKGKKVPVAVQLYSLRTVAPMDVPGTLRKVADLGYEGVEFAGYYDLKPGEIRKMLDDCGLLCVGSHVRLDGLDNGQFDSIVEMNKRLGNDRLIVPGADLDNLDKTIERLGKVHKKAQKAGMKVGFHNHTREFDLVDGKTKFDRIFSGTPDDFLVQLDIGWASRAGQDVPAILRKYGKRIETVHVKESNPNKPSAVVGDGDVNWPEIFGILEKETAVASYIVEQEAFEVDPFDSVKECLVNIRKMGR